ncbi:MAG: hypothetical protein R6X06_09570 [Gammaproteobacteria bacterium]
MQQELLAIIEYGGYPDFSSLYTRLGFSVVQMNNMRKVIQYLKRRQPAVIVAEFNFQSDFRDRTSSLESLLAVTQRWPEIRVIILYDAEFRPQFDKLAARFVIAQALAFPVTEEQIARALASTGAPQPRSC